MFLVLINILKASYLNSNWSSKVHCLGGLSRSVSVTCAYLIAAKGMTAEEALTYTHDCRRIAHPNQGFKNQLRTYAAQFGLSDQEEAEIAASSTQNNKVLSGLTGGLTGRRLPGMKLLRAGSVRQMVKDSVSGVLDGNNDVLKVAKVKALGPDWQGAATIVTHTTAGPNASVNVDVTETVVQPDSSVQVTETHATIQNDATVSAETTTVTLPPAFSKIGFKIPGLPGLDKLRGQFGPGKTVGGLEVTALGVAEKPFVTAGKGPNLSQVFLSSNSLNLQPCLTTWCIISNTRLPRTP